MVTVSGHLICKDRVALCCEDEGALDQYGGGGGLLRSQAACLDVPGQREGSDSANPNGCREAKDSKGMTGRRIFNSYHSN